MDYTIRVKPVTTASKKPHEAQERDTFQTPAYATELLLPFIPDDIKYIWECAAGSGLISRVLCRNGYVVCSTDIRDKKTPNQDNEVFFNYNFLTNKNKPFPDVIRDWFDNDKKVAIITNPPFSIKDDFIEMAFSYGVPFAFLINADYSGKTIDWIQRGCEKIIPISRIAFITPNILRRIHEGEVWRAVYKEFLEYSSLKELEEFDNNIYLDVMVQYQNYHNYATIDDCPQELLYRYSSAQFHSMWLTYGFNLGRTETFVELPVETRKMNIR